MRWEKAMTTKSRLQQPNRRDPVKWDRTRPCSVQYETHSVPNLAGNTPAWWDQASTAAFSVTPQPHGNTDSVVITGIDFGIHKDEMKRRENV